MSKKDELLNYADPKAVEEAMKNTTPEQMAESASRTYAIEFEQENLKPKKRSKKDAAIMKAEQQRRRRAKNKAKPMGKKRGGVIKMKDGGFPDLSGDGKVTQKDILIGKGVIKKKRGGMARGSREGSIINTRTSFKNGGAVKGKKAGRLAKRGYGKARK
tara:strand:+ start:171 stop:647 length:477 start_codon:yes stop_codon:yes gene_type:complete